MLRLRKPRAGLASAEGERDRVKGLYEGLAGAGSDAASRAVKIGRLVLVAAAVAAPMLRAQESAPSAVLLVYAARAYDRANQLDSARRAYEAAAGELELGFIANIPR